MIPMKYAPYFFFLLCLACLFAIAPASCAKEPITPIAVLEENEDIPPDTTPTPVSAPAKDGKWTNLIYFTGVGTKKIMAKYAKLKVVG